MSQPKEPTIQIPPIENRLSEATWETHREFLEEYRRIREREGRGSRDAEFYLQLPEGNFTGHRAKEWAMRADSLSWIHAHLKSCESKLSILDAGAGNCWLTRYIAEWGHHVVALDLNEDDEDGLGAGRHYLEQLPLTFRRVLADFSALPFADGSFDLIVYNGALHYAPDVALCIAEGTRCLKPGGEILLIDTPFYRDAADGEKMLAERGGPQQARYLTYRMLNEIAAGCELSVQYEHRTRSLLQAMKRRLAERLRGRSFAQMPWVKLRKSV